MKTSRRWIDLDPESSEHLNASHIPVDATHMISDLLGKLLAAPDDTVMGPLSDKLEAGSGVTLSVVEVNGAKKLRISASGGGGSAPVDNRMFNPMSRYPVLTTEGLGVTATSVSRYVLNCAWSRTGDVVAIEHAAHGRSVGDRIILRNGPHSASHEDDRYGIGFVTDVVSADLFEVTTSGTYDLSSGSELAYGLGFTYEHEGEPGAITGGILHAPANANVLLTSLRIRIAANQRATTTYNLSLPKSSYSGVADNASINELYMPLFMVRADSDASPAVAALIARNRGGDLGVYQFQNLGAATTPLQMLLQF